MSSDERKEYFPTGADNILSDEPVSHRHENGYPEEDIEKPELFHTRSSTDIGPETPKLNRSQTTRSTRLARERTFEPINAGDRAELHRIASEFGGSVDLVRTATINSTVLERKDTLAGLEVGDPVLDPTSPEFDPYKWVRMYGLPTSSHTNLDELTNYLQAHAS
jgi:ATP-binding cassette, subfamily G (WHITE), member 2, PDR